MSSNRNVLVARKEKLLQDLKYYDKKIELERSLASNRSSSGFEDGDSSDSDVDLTLNVKTGPSILELKHQKEMLKTCLCATEELTQLEILQTEVNVMVQDPVVKGPPVVEGGVWREVTVECRVDMVHFSIAFYVHRPHRKFAAPSYRGLRVAAVKKNHDVELKASVLPDLEIPSDAVEMIRNYAVAHRSRRETLKCLAEKFGDTLHMDILPDGGYQLKCNGIFEISWRLQNKWSPVAWFHHRMKFDIEAIDESYLKKIRHANNQLPNPSLKTSERTQLLSIIISTCLEARGQLYESMESDSESNRTLEKSRTTLDYEPEEPIHHNKKEKELMAPPKSLPKKTKRKSDDAKGDNAKRSRADVAKASDTVANKNNEKVQTNNGAAVASKKTEITKAVVNDGNKLRVENIDRNTVKDVENLSKPNKNTAVVKNKVANVGKNKNVKATGEEKADKQKKVISESKNMPNKIVQGDTQKLKAKVAEKVDKPKSTNTAVVKNLQNIAKNANTKNILNNNANNNKVQTNKYVKPKENVEKVSKPKQVASIDAENNKNIANKLTNKASLTGKLKKSINPQKNTKTLKNNDQNVHETIEKVIEKRQSIKNKDKIVEKTITERVSDITKKANTPNKISENVKRKQSEKIIKPKQTANVKKSTQNQGKTGNNAVEKQKNITNEIVANKPKILTDKLRQSIKNINKNNVNKLPIRKPELNAIKMAASKQNGVKPKQNGVKTKEDGSTSKIPQKMIAGGVVKKNPLRISPRKLPAAMKSAVQGALQSKTAAKTTNIPRLLKKTITKAT